MGQAVRERRAYTLRPSLLAEVLPLLKAAGCWSSENSLKVDAVASSSWATSSLQPQISWTFDIRNDLNTPDNSIQYVCFYSQQTHKELMCINQINWQKGEIRHLHDINM